MSQGRTDLSVVVVTHDGRDLALETLSCARAATGGAAVQWLVVDAGSTDGTPDAIESRFSDIDVLRLPNVGFAAANNAVLPRARGRYVLLLNPDVEIETGTLADLVHALDQRPDVGAASVVQRDGDGELLRSIRRFPSPARQLGEALTGSRWPLGRSLREPVGEDREYGRERSADWLVGAFLAVRREAIEQVGALDERFFLYCEETDWCHRIRAAGWDVRHLPGLTVTHRCGGYDNPELLAQLTYSKLLFAEKHLGRVSAAGIRAGLALRHSLRLAALAPVAAVRPARRPQLRAELGAFAIAGGLAAAPFRDAPAPAGAIA